jgi:hypothetical protein
VFDSTFYETVLPALVMKECSGRTDQVPVVEFRLGDGSVLDVCHVLSLADKWFTVTYFRDPSDCEDMDIALLPYELVTRISVSLHHALTRPLGFRPEPKPQATPKLGGAVKEMADDS